MSDNKMLIGSLSNDLNRVANLSYRGSVKAAQNFWLQAQRWIADLQFQKNKPYINNIIASLAQEEFDPTDKAQAEKNLMYSIILQNYTLKLE
jgi:uncharacterized protein YfaS (alpha-2-macroglobulin family)